MLTEIITRFLNWHSVQRYYADFGDVLAKIYVTSIDILCYLALFILCYIIVAWILHPITVRRGIRAKKESDAEATTQIVNLLTENNLLLLSIYTEIRKHET